MQVKFHKDVRNLLEVLRDRNPFTDHSKNLLRLDTREVMEEEVIASYRLMDELGKGLHEILVNDRLVKCSVPYSDTIYRNSFHTFSNKPEAKNIKPDKFKFLLCQLQYGHDIMVFVYVWKVKLTYFWAAYGDQALP